MTNFAIYKKTLVFSLIAFLIDLIGLAAMVGFATGGFFLFNNTNGNGLGGLVIGLIIGVIIAVLISVFITNRIKAAQISMMTKGVVEGALPDNIYKTGLEEMKGRFGTITAFYFISNAIKGVFNQIGNAINKIGTAVGGDAGNAVTSAINSAVQVLIGYLSDCCLGWVLFRKEVNPFQAGCEGAVIFFKHGKTLIRNVGRIFGMGLASFVVIAGLFGGILSLICYQFPTMFQALSNEIIDIIIKNGGTVADFLNNPTYVMLVAVAFVSVILWSIVHSVFIRPFILIGVLRNFMAAGIQDIPTKEDLSMLDSKSPRFAKLHKKAMEQ